MSATIFLLTIGMPLATILLVFGIIYAASVMRARIAVQNGEPRQQDVLAELAEIKTRLAAIEKILKDVE